ncbi:ubiquinol-cytochrome c reductase iron-sulfur subunit [Nocardioides ginsengisegetis]|uniref:Cytochrome bc1 complex Rieske iron-sulfur subunit n=1 Tax=Nocardioides ginsengisegetis TaxID=661491 RepID=A0A7W3P9S0_9ACTN|nr:Rieske 2Fe-2S domain-containing protein [Nocardioides sp. LS1]MBA8804000.1 ubiquinol-cytochrome c reductase iron-sulfur subunit [Nocardioides ginsengisegetis]GCD91790.1 cytochrome bc1 complex Rieske iron-sulfur subunit [Nocardioides sp. LS1]
MSDSHNDHDDRVPATFADEPIGNPGLPAHTWRPTDVDPKAEKRAERQVAALFGLSMLCAVLFLVCYFTFKVGGDAASADSFAGLGASNVTLGATLGGALLLIGIGIIQWARKLMGDHEISEYRHTASSSEDDRAATVAALQAGLEESGIGRRPLIRNTLLGAVGILGLPAVVMLRDLGPLPGDKLQHTIWAKGMRVVRDVVGTPIHVADLEIGDLVNAEPEALFPTEENGYPEIEGVDLQVQKVKAAVILHRMQPDDIIPGKGRENWSVNGIVCYSKICTHVGCPISLNERTTHHLLCPCHQSTFDLTDSGKVIFGPAGHALPQLPLAVDDEGYLIAQSDFTEPVGPSFWERDSN